MSAIGTTLSAASAISELPAGGSLPAGRPTNVMASPGYQPGHHSDPVRNVYQGFDFGGVWGINPGINGGMPFHLSELEAGVFGDINGDGTVDLKDLLAVIDHIFDKTRLDDDGLAAVQALAPDGYTVDLKVLLAIIDIIFGK